MQISGIQNSRLCHCLHLFFTATTMLWVVDAAAYMELIRRFLTGDSIHARFTDYLGLLLVDASLALCVILCCLLCSLILSLIFKDFRFFTDSTGVFSTMMSLLILYSGTRILFPIHNPSLTAVLLLAISAISAAFFLIPRRLMNVSDISTGRNGIHVQGMVFFFLVSLSYLLQCFAKLADHHWVPFLIHAGTFSALVAFLCLLYKSKKMYWVEPARFVFTLSIVLLAVQTCYETKFCPTSEVEITSDCAHRPPNIVLIVLDTLRADHLKRYGYGLNTMPALEKWAVSGS